MIWLFVIAGAVILWTNRGKIMGPLSGSGSDSPGSGGGGDRPGGPDEPNNEELISAAYREAIDAPITWLNTNHRAFNRLYEYDERNCGDARFGYTQDQEHWMNAELNRSILRLKEKHNSHYCISPHDFEWIWNFTRQLASVWEAHLAWLDREDKGCEGGERPLVEAWLTVINQFAGVLENLEGFYSQYGRQAEDIWGPVVNELPLPPA